MAGPTLDYASRAIKRAVKRPDKLFNQNYGLIGETPKRMRLFGPSIKGVPAKAKQPKAISLSSMMHSGTFL